MLRISIQDDFLDMAQAFNELSTKELMAASYRAINRSLVTVRADAIEQLRERINIKSTRLKDDYIKMYKAKGGSLTTAEGLLVFSGMRTPLREFVKGNKDVIEQKGIPVKRRRKLRFEIKPGKTFKLKGAFIQKVNTTQVFMRKASGGFNTQSVSSIATIMERNKILERIVSNGQVTLQGNMWRELEYRLAKLHGKIPDKK